VRHVGRQQTLSIVVPWEDADDLRVVLACLQIIDRHQIAKHRLPPLYLSGTRYKTVHGSARCKTNAPESCERFLSALQLLKERVGDCKDFACYLAAERMLAGDYGARAIPIPSSVGFHVQTQHGDGTIEDPSVVLGMKVL